MRKIKIKKLEFYRLRHTKGTIVGNVKFSQLFRKEEFIKFIYDIELSTLRGKLENYHILKNYDELNASRAIGIGDWIDPNERRELEMELYFYIYSDNNHKKLTRRSLFRKLKNNLVISEINHNNYYKDLMIIIQPSDIDLRGFLDYSLRYPDNPDKSYCKFLVNILEFLEALETLINE